MKKFIIPPEDGYQAYLERNYVQIRRMQYSDISIISKNTGISEAELKQLKDHLFLKTHMLSNNGAPLKELYFQADPEIAYAWQRSIEGNLSEEELEWFKQLRNHELKEDEYMLDGMLLRDPSTYDPDTSFGENAKLNAHDRANLVEETRQPDDYPNYPLEYFNRYYGQSKYY